MQLRVFFENMFFSPKYYHYPIILLFLPLSLIYGLLMFIRRVFTKKINFNIPIISIGNLIVGGSGKTPFTIEIASKFNSVTIISRGYGRLSQGLVEVSRDGKILTTVKNSGDEAMLMAKSLKNASVIVSEDRKKAIELAKKQGAKLIILDDGFNRVDIDKFEILLEPNKIKNYLPFPAGAFREFWFSKRYADIMVKEDIDFRREVGWVQPTNTNKNMVLITAISNPTRLDPFLPKNIVAKKYLQDHAFFNKDDIYNFCKNHDVDTLLATSKDIVKLESMGLELTLVEMKLKIIINNDIIKKINNYVKEY